VCNTFSIPPLPTDPSLGSGFIKSENPFKLNAMSSADPWGIELLPAGDATTITIPEVNSTPRLYYLSDRHSEDVYVSGVIKMQRSATNETAYLCTSSLAPANGVDPYAFERYTLALILKTFLDGGNYTGSGHIPQVPRVTLTKPEANQEIAPSSIAIEWEKNWKRWDGQKYSEEYNSSYNDNSITCEYYLKYSDDTGATWHFCDDGTSTAPGQRNTAHVISGASTSAAWNASALSSGNYLLLLECFRKDYQLHYSFDKRQIYIQH
jgi:hypothetical protein